MSAILVVDDHRPTRELLRALLGYKGHRVTLAENAEQGLALVHETGPDLVLADVVMPGMDGFAFLEAVRACAKCGETPVILMSASLDEDRASALARSGGACDYLVKPIEPEALLERVQRALGEAPSAAPAPPADEAEAPRQLFVDSLVRKVEEIEALNRGLEEQVQQRTRELNDANARLREQAIRDPLTGLFNRRYLEETLPRELDRCAREGRPLALALLDLDHFKRVNDQHGHEAGDAVLRRFGEELQKAMRRSDIACRLGGEEFVLVLPGAESEAALRRVEALRARFAERIVVAAGRYALSVTLSAGLACFPGDGATGEALLRAADEAMYRAKQAGRNRVCCAGAA